MFILFFSISFVSLVVTLFILCIIPHWDSATAHSPSSKELKPSSQEDARFSGRCTSAYIFHLILRYPSLGLSNNSLTLWKRALNPSSHEDARFSGRCTSAYIVHFSLRHPSLGLSNSSLILPWRAQNFFSWKITFVRACCLLMFSHYHAWALFGLLLTHITH